MRLLFDQNISHRILALLSEEYSESTTVKIESLTNATDKQIWEFAKLNNYIIVSQDSDFNDLNLLLGFPPKIIWIRTGNIKTKTLLSILTDYSTEIKNFANDYEHGCFEIINLK